MTTPVIDPPIALQALQARFTQLIRHPLNTRSGTFTPDLTHADPTLVASVIDGARGTATERLGVYQRQYWLRMFTVMQNELPLSARLIGMFRFNQLVQHYLSDCPPREQDLGRVPDRFSAWRQDHASVFHRLDVRVPKPALTQALAIDQAWRQVWSAPRTPPFQPTPEHAEALPRMQLAMAPTHVLVEDDWPLIEQRRSLMTDSNAENIALPQRLGSKRHWLIFRTTGDKQTTGSTTGIAQMRLEPRQAQLYTLCTTLPLGQAIARLEQQCSREERAALADHVRAWFARSVELGVWREARS